MQHIANHIEPMKTLAIRIARNRLTELERDLIDITAIDMEVLASNGILTMRQLQSGKMLARKKLNHHLKTLYSLT